MAELSPVSLGTVHLQTALMGLTLAFKEHYGDATFEITKAYVENTGRLIGSQLKETYGITGSDVSAIEHVYHAWLDPAYTPHQPDIQVDGNVVRITRTSSMLCPAMVAAKQMKLPLDLVCETVAIPMFRGVAKSVSNEAMHTSTRSPQQCIDQIQLPT